MRCKYCFYLDKSELYSHSRVHRMGEDTLEKLISSYMSLPMSCYTFGWQGGEPTLMGLDFFKKVIKLQKKYGKAGCLVSNGLQTNGTLIDEDFSRFLSEYKFLVGVSLDGTQHIHDHYRKKAGGEGSFDNVMRGIDKLRKNNVIFNILVLVNDFNAVRATEVYDFLVKNGFYYHQYIPCVEFRGKNELEKFSINGEMWGKFLIDIFNKWYPADMNKVSIRLFDEIINRLSGNKPNICHMRDNCCQYFVVEHNGDVYPCDFFVSKDLKIGNINSESFKDLLESPLYGKFGKMKSLYSFLCNSCQYLDLCFGDCLKHRNYILDSPMKLSTLCSGWKMFYNRSIDDFKKIAGSIKQ